LKATVNVVPVILTRYFFPGTNTISLLLLDCHPLLIEEPIREDVNKVHTPVTVGVKNNVVVGAMADFLLLLKTGIDVPFADTTVSS
jgi:hypothetical protein